MPRTVTTTKEVYKFSELSDSAKERAREWYREGNLDYDWWDSSFEDFARIAKLLGVDLYQRSVKLMNGSFRSEDSIFFSGFSSQGDGACWEGNYSYRKGSVKAIKEYAPNDTKLHRIAEDLYDIQRRYFYKVSAKATNRGRYYHSGCMSFDVCCDSEQEFHHEQEVIDLLRSFADWMYRQLNDEYDYLNSDEAVDESMEANDYEFDEDGNRF